MQCFVHDGTDAVGICGVCGKAVCRDCVLPSAPRLVCRACDTSSIHGFEYKSEASIGTLPLVHICTGVDPVTRRPRIAKGVIAIGNIAMGVLSVGGVAVGLFSLGGLSVGLLAALGGAAIGIGVSVGGLAIGSVAIGGAAIGFSYAMGGAAFAPAAIDGMHCDEVARRFFEQYAPGMIPPNCR
jgi:hypothetical protein